MTACGCITHPAEVSHEEHMDALDRAGNQRILQQAQDLITSGGSRIEYHRAVALLNRFSELELVRLAAKARWMKGAS